VICPNSSPKSRTSGMSHFIFHLLKSEAYSHYGFKGWISNRKIVAILLSLFGDSMVNWDSNDK
jgi:hypothetical protein